MTLGPWRKIVSERRKHHNESIAPIRQGENAELVGDVRSVRDGGKQPIRLFSSTPCGKKATTPRSVQASGPSS
jgi:hypothetical protein